MLLIGDAAIDFQRAPHTHEIFDPRRGLDGTDRNWRLVHVVWALRRGVQNSALRGELRSSKRFGMETLDEIIAHREEYDEDFRRDYFEWHIHYHLAKTRSAPSKYSARF